MPKQYDLEIGTPKITPTLPTDYGARLARPVGEYRPMTPEAMAMVDKLVASGMDLELAQTAVLDYMGFDRKDPQQAAWDQYTKEHPYMAASKKLLTHAGQGVAAAGKKLASPVDMEKMSAAKMLKDYIQSQDALRAHEQLRGRLYQIASQSPGTWQSGIALTSPGSTPEEAARNNQIYAQQDAQRDY